ncbi:MAG: hypothetical protein DELT_02341 [Desulfovibrio sp.]
MKEYLKAVCADGQCVNPLFRFLGASVRVAEKGRCVIDLPLSGKLTQGDGLVAGGILATIADEAMAHAVISILEPGRRTVTTEMNIRYLRTADPNTKGTLTSTATVVKPGRRVMVTEAAIHDDAGRLLATAGGSFIVLERDGA